MTIAFSFQMGDENLEYTPEEALSAVGFGKFQLLTLAYAGLGLISEAMEMMSISYVGIAVKSEWGISPGEESLLTTVVFVGMAFGAYFWGLISDIYGRRRGFVGATFVVAVAAICSAFSPNYKLLLMFRCFLGFGVGAGHLYAAWFLEFVPIPYRGAWILVLTGFWTFGTTFEALLAWIIMPKLGWRWLISLSCIPSLLAVLLYGLTPESPRYLAIKGKTAEAQEILEKVVLMNRTKLPLGVLVCNRSIKIDEENSPSSETPLLPSRENNRCQETCLSSIFALFSLKLRRIILHLWFLSFVNAFLYYGIVLLTSELSSGQSSCKSSSNRLENANDSRFYRDVVITTVAEIPGVILAIAIVDRIGRKLSMEMMNTFSFILLLPLVVHQNEIVTTALLSGSRMFIVSTSNVMTVYSREVYPTSVRATGAGIATSIGRIGAMICPLVAVGLVRGCHQTAAIILFEAIIILLGSLIFLLPIETSGKGLNDTLPSSDE